MVHGLVQRIQDRAAISRDPKTGKAAPPAEKLAAMKELVDYYNSGATEWNSPRSESAARGSYLLNALCEMFAGEQTREELSNWLKERSAEERAALELEPQVAQLIDKQRREKLGGTTEVAKGLLGQLKR